MKHVLYEDKEGWALTPEDNYYPMIGDTSKITHFSKDKFSTSADVGKYIKNILKLRPDMIIVKLKHR